MYKFLRCVWEPTPTSPVNPYAGRDDRRTVNAKVASGLRLGGGLIAGFAVLVLAFAGVSSLPEGAPAFGQYALLASLSMLTVATIVMFWTVNRWAPYVPGFFFFPAIFKCVTLILIGPNPHSSISSNRLTRSDAAELLVYCVVVIALTWRFMSNRPAPTTFVDRLALTFFVLATLKQAVTAYHWPPLPLISGLTALLIAYWNSRRTLKQTHLFASTPG
jgi:hypothetical protein